MSDLSEAPAPQVPLPREAVQEDSAPSAETLTEVSVTETKATVEQVMVAPEPPPASAFPQTAVQLALSAGWTMALYGNLAAAQTGNGELPTVDELTAPHKLPPEERADIELRRLSHLLTSLIALPGFAGSTVRAAVPRDAPAEVEALLATLERLANARQEAVAGAAPADPAALNVAILNLLATARPEVEQAYHLGRALRDTVSPSLDGGDGAKRPHDHKALDQLRSAALAKALQRARVATLQEWLATLSAHFPRHSAAIVATSLGRWSDFAAVTIGTDTKTRLRKARPQKADPGEANSKEADSKQASEKEVTAKEIREHLLPQGELWLMLLTGERTTNGLLSPEGYVAAGEAALRRSARLVRKILKHHAAVWIILAVAVAGLLYLSLRYLAGSAKVWTSIATVGGSLGAAARSISNTIGRLTAEAERPILAMAEEDAMAWAITTLPAVKLTPRGVRMLRKAGIAPSSELGRA